MRHQKRHYKVFPNAAHKMIRLSGQDRLLLDFLCERMDDHNRITIDKDMFKAFKYFIEHITSKADTAKDHQLKRSLSRLLETELLFRARRGLYVISPKHFTKTTLKKNRETFAKFQEHLEATTENKTLLNTPRKKAN